MLGSENPKTLAEFYEKVIGRPADMVDGDWHGWSVGHAFLSIGSHSEVKGTAKEPSRMIFNFESTDVKAEFDRIKAIEGVEVVKEPYSMDESGADNSLIATFADPDGNYFQLMSPWE